MRKLFLTLSVFFYFYNAQGQPLLPDGFVAQQIFSDRNPIAMDIDPSGRLFVTELTGNILLIENGVLQEDPVGTIPVDNTGERGLYGIAFDPDFEFNNYIYLYYSVLQANHNRLSRFKLHENHIHYEDEEILLEFDFTTAVIHNGGDIKFGPDGKLYIAVGDRGMPPTAQSHESLFGKILRINADGSVPTDNPFYSSNQGIYKSIYAYGLRNPFTFNFSEDDKLFANDVGQSDYEEINNILPGKNYGWPTIEGMLGTNGVTAPENYMDPVYAYSHAIGCAITGSSFYDPETSLFPDEFKGKYFFGDYCNNTVTALDTETLEVSTFLENGNGPTFIKVSNSGEMYIGSFGGGSKGSLWKISYSTDGTPKILLQPESVIATVGESVSFSIKANGELLTYQWKRNDVLIPGANESSLQLTNVSLEDNNAVFSCVVENTNGLIESYQVLLTVTERTRPDITIDMTENNSYYIAGDIVIIKGSALDNTQGLLPASALTWEVEFHHDYHSHPILTNIYGVDSIGFIVPRVGETSSNVWYRIYLQAINEVGLSQTSYTELFPRKSTFTVKTSFDEVSSYPVFLDGSLHMTPFTITSVAGMTRNLSVTPSEIIDGYLYQNNTTDETSVTFNVPEEDTVFLFTGDYNKTYFGEGFGLTGKYYNRPLTFEGTPDVIQIDSRLDFNWGYQPPLSNFNNDYFSIVWEGYVRIPVEGIYIFYATSDDGVRLWIDNALLIDELKNAPSDEFSASKHLAIGIYPIKVNYYEDAGESAIKLSWSSDQLSKNIIPADVLYDQYYKPQVSFVQEQDSVTYTKELYFKATATDYRMQVIEGSHFAWALSLVANNTSSLLFTFEGVDSLFYLLSDTLEYNADAYLFLELVTHDMTGFTDTLSKKIYFSQKPAIIQEAVKIYPNPIFDTMELELNEFAEKADQLIIYDAMGRLVFQKNLINSSERKVTLNLSHLPPGFYIAKLQMGDSFISKKFTKY